jgi:deoxycytidine triphosphate deaminase
MLTIQVIDALIDKGQMDWTGEFRGDGLLLCLGAPLQPLMEPLAAEVDLMNQASIDALYQLPLHDWETFTLRPGRLVLCQVSEPLRLGSRLCGVIGTLSHLARVGLMTHISSPFVLAGWNGHLTLELFNAGPAPLKVYFGMPVARLMVVRMAGPAREAVPAHSFYGRTTSLGSRYAHELFCVRE